LKLMLLIMAIVGVSSFAFASRDNDPSNEDQVLTLAIEVLSKELNVPPSEISLIHQSKFNWPNSALGCPKPGIAYTQSIVPGHLVLLKHQQSQFRVHTGNGRALVCKLSRIPLKLDGVILDNLEQMAINDLATRLGATVESIKVVESEPMVWPDSNFGCATASVMPITKSVRGHLIKLVYRDQIFEYRTSRSKVKPCPAIETQ